MAAIVKEMVVAELDGVPPALLPEVLRFIRFIKSHAMDIPTAANEPGLVTVTPEQVVALSGIADYSGDALADTEHLYAE